jgi:hypothetical protein
LADGDRKPTPLECPSLARYADATLARCRCSPAFPVTDDDTETLVELLRHAEFPDVADKLERGLALGTRVLALTIVDRESILRALEECPKGLGELRSVLLREHEWRVREGLV